MKNLIFVLFLAMDASGLHADSVAQPPTQGRQWSTTLTSTSQQIKFTSGNNFLQSGALLIVHDGDTGGPSGTGAPDIYFALNASSVSAPTSGSQTLTLRQTDQALRFDGQFGSISMMSESDDVTVRVLISYTGNN